MVNISLCKRSGTHLSLFPSPIRDWEAKVSIATARQFVCTRGETKHNTIAATEQVDDEEQLFVPSYKLQVTCVPSQRPHHISLAIKVSFHSLFYIWPFVSSCSKCLAVMSSSHPCSLTVTSVNMLQWGRGQLNLKTTLLKLSSSKLQWCVDKCWGEVRCSRDVQCVWWPVASVSASASADLVFTSGWCFITHGWWLVVANCLLSFVFQMSLTDWSWSGILSRGGFNAWVR